MWDPKGTQMLVGNFEQTPERDQDTALWAWLEMFFIPMKFEKTNHTTTPFSA